MDAIQHVPYFCDYYEDWIETYKKGFVRPITYNKYLMTQKRLKEIAPDLRITDLNKRSYQTILNKYAETHERQTTMDFHHQLKGAVLDAIDEEYIKVDPTRKAVVKGKPPSEKKSKFLNQSEFDILLKSLNLTKEPNWDWLILLVAKTGLRFAEALGLTPADFDFEHKKINVSKTWNYKDINGGFSKTKNVSSVRVIPIDAQLSKQFKALIKKLPADEPVFVNSRVFNSTVNNRLRSICKKAGITIISVHGLRHTHASLLIFAGVSIASIAKRLGHSNITTTQETYLHIIKELENQDNDKIMKFLSGFKGAEAS